MKRFLYSLIQKTIVVLLLFKISNANGQQLTPLTKQVKPGKTVNFKDIADYLLLHPEKSGQCIIDQNQDKDKDYVFVPEHVPANTPVYNAIINSERSSTSKSPAPLKVFNGCVSSATYFPPDINGAVGENYILESTNQELDVYTKTGTQYITLDINALFAPDSGFYYFDPHVEYDAAHKRFLLVCDGFYVSTQASALFIAVSQTSDPTGNWYTYSIDGSDNNPNSFLDYPLLGYNGKWIVLTGNYFNLNAGTTQSDIYVLNRANLYSGTLGTAKEFFDHLGVTVAPAQTYDTTQSSEYFVQNSNGNQGGNGYVKIGSITGSANSPVFSLGSNLGVNSPWSDDGSIGATQKGTSQNIESGLDTKIENVVFRNGSLWFTHNVYLPAASPTHCAVDWWQVNPSPLTVTQFGRVEDPTGVTNYYYPSINVNANGNVLLGYCTSSPNIYASAKYSYRSSTDAKNGMDSGFIFQKGLAPYVLVDNNNRNRYGDYTFTAIDPTDNSFWTFEEYAYSFYWGTSIANVAAGPSGINTVSISNASIEVYPNPTTGQFDVAFNNLPNGIYSVSLYNVFGQKLSETQIPLNSKYSKIPMDASMLAAGLYFVQVVSNTGEWTQRIIKR